MPISVADADAGDIAVTQHKIATSHRQRRATLLILVILSGNVESSFSTMSLDKLRLAKKREHSACHAMP